MSSPAANCPNCGAPVKFLWSSAVQTTCEFCHSILVRTDVDLKKVGEVADLPPDASPLQIGSEGAYQNKNFVVVGRIIYEYEHGGWSEWHIVYSDGTSGWLSDAQLEYDLSWSIAPPTPLPGPDQISQGQTFQWNGKAFQVTSRTHAHYKGVQGELPFEYWDKSDLMFADLRSAGGDFATIDYSGNPPLLFLGRTVEFDELHLKNLREFEGWT
ncbi:MAG TPA: DUF4178 domain-containing protein [Bryobacteraceae bacterium]|jgi:hypothetical protein|nr:DUF4178 domain-containing protein [Bryobacteraceae bacterium]